MSQQVFPLGTGSDDWASLVNTLTTKSYKEEVKMMPVAASGTPANWFCLSKQVWPSGSLLVAEAPGVTVKYQIGGVGGSGEDASPIYNDYFNLSPSPITSVSTQGVVGTPSLVVASASGLATGNRILVRDATGGTAKATRLRNPTDQFYDSHSGRTALLPVSGVV